MKTIFYFTAEWCNPCKQTRPIVEEFVRDTSEITVLFIDVDIEIELAQELDVRSIPTLILFENEKQIRRVTGAQNKATLKEFVYG